MRNLLSEPFGEDDIEDTRQLLKNAQLIVYPTETLYALGADPFSEKAIKRLFEAKKRPENMPVSIVVADKEMMMEVSWVTELAEEICRAFLPGPVTILLAKKPGVPQLLTGGSDKVGIRIPDHPVTLRLIRSLGPITATSANTHNQAEPWNIDTAIRQLGDSVALYLDGGISQYQAPSTILDATGTSVKIIRRGVISEEEIISVLN